MSAPAVEQALRIAVDAHAGQVRPWSNEPYICHPLRVAGRVYRRCGADGMAVALLHDVCEDTTFTLAHLRERFDEYGVIYRAVDLLTRPNERAYRDYIGDLKGAVTDAGELARVVKRADLLDNLRDLPDEQARLRSRYMHALGVLMDNA